MRNIGDMLDYVLEHYDLSLKTDEGTKVKLLLTELIPQKIASMLSIEKNLNYKVYGSFGGRPKIAFIPWVVIIDKTLCDGESAQKGIYPVLLFNEDMSEVYLSLNLGTTFFKDHVKREKFKNPRDLINTTKIALQKLIEIDSKDLNEINNLGGKKDRYYVEGNIASISYKKNQMPSDEAFKQDLIRMMDYVREYKKLKEYHVFEVFINKVLNNTINLPSDVQDALYQEKVDISVPEDQDDDLPVKKNGKMKTKSNRYIGNPKVTKRALVNADYLCEYDASHLTFVNDTTWKELC